MYASTLPASLEALERVPTPPQASDIKLLVLGLLPAERRLIEGAVKRSQRRAPRLQLVDPRHSQTADVVIIDAQDAQALDWFARHPHLAAKAAIWIDAQTGPYAHLLAQRPAPWDRLPSMLACALEHHAAVWQSEGWRAAQAMAGDDRARAPVLIIESGAAARGELSQLFRRRGVAVLDVGDLPQALEIIATQPVAWTLVGMRIGAASSAEHNYASCQRIKLAAPRLPVVMLGRTDAACDRARAKEVGAAALIMLPDDVHQLYAVIDQSAAAARVPVIDPL